MEIWMENIFFKIHIFVIAVQQRFPLTDWAISFFLKRDTFFCVLLEVEKSADLV